MLIVIAWCGNGVVIPDTHGHGSHVTLHVFTCGQCLVIYLHCMWWMFVATANFPTHVPHMPHMPHMRLYHVIQSGHWDIVVWVP